MNAVNRPPLEERVARWKQDVQTFRGGAVPDIAGFAPYMHGQRTTSDDAMWTEYPLDYEEGGIVLQALNEYIARRLTDASNHLHSHFGPLNTAHAMLGWIVRDRIERAFEDGAEQRRKNQIKANRLFEERIVVSAPPRVYRTSVNLAYEAMWSSPTVCTIGHPRTDDIGANDTFACYAGNLAVVETDSSTRTLLQLNPWDLAANEAAIQIWQHLQEKNGYSAIRPVIEKVYVDGVEGVYHLPTILLREPGEQPTLADQVPPVPEPYQG